MGDSKKMEIKKEMETNGFSQGVIVSSEIEGDCPFVIDIDDDNYDYFLDPVDLPESFKKEGLNIWFKFVASRMANRCDKANPVSLNGSIQIREE